MSQNQRGKVRQNKVYVDEKVHVPPPGTSKVFSGSELFEIRDTTAALDVS